MASPSPRLPGFLRRSLRADYSNSEDEADDLEATEQSSSCLQPPQTSSRQDQSSPSCELWLDSQPAVASHSSTHPSSFNNTASKRATIPPSIPTNPINRQSSEPRSVNNSSAPPEGEELHRQRSASAASSCQLTSSRTKTYRETQFEKIFAANVVSMTDLRTVAWNGIPSQYRPQSWKILLGYLPTNASRRQNTLQKKRAEYLDAVAQHYDIDDNSRTMQEQEVLRQVLVDVPRTAPSVKLFRDERIKTLLTRILYVWAMRHPASSYVQGINDLVMPLIVTYLTQEDTVDCQPDSPLVNGKDINYDDVLEGRIMETVSDDQLQKVEADCYYCLTNLLAGIQDHYTSDQPGVQRMVLRLEELVNRIDAELCAHLRQTGIEFMQFAFKWMNCLLLREFNLKCVIRLWDTYISEKGGFEDFHVYVCAAFLCQFSSRLQTMSFDELFGFMQAMPTGDWGDTEVEMLLSQAYVLSTLFGGSDAHLNPNDK